MKGFTVIAVSRDHALRGFEIILFNNRYFINDRVLDVSPLLCSILWKLRNVDMSVLEKV